jgi:putative addiction module killer protein/probable addiction module antidote protein
MYEVRHYFTREGRDLYSHWRDGIRDRQAAIAIDRRVNRLELGNFGDCKPCRDGVWELRIDTGPGLGSITQSQERPWCCCFALETSERSQAISTAHAYIGATGKEGTMRDRAHDDAMAERFRHDPEYAVDLLNGILRDGNQAELLIALRQMARAFGGVQKIADEASLNPTQLYRTLSADGNPELSSLSAILKAMGFRLAVERAQGLPAA